jgi:hypothetical protein
MGAGFMEDPAPFFSIMRVSAGPTCAGVSRFYGVDATHKIA